MDFRQTIDYIMRAMAEEYPGKFTVSEPRAKMWRQMLSGLKSNVILAAVYQLISTTDSQWPPTIGMVRTKAVQFTNGDLHTPTGQEAWENILKKFQYEDYPLTDLEKAALAQVGTIYDLKRSQNTMVDRSNFTKAFDTLVEKQQVERATMPNVKALVEHNIPLLEKGDEPAPALPESTQQSPGRPPLPHRTIEGSKMPTPEEVKDYMKQLGDMFDAANEKRNEETAERKAIRGE